jgi:hypothetical protein
MKFFIHVMFHVITLNVGIYFSLKLYHMRMRDLNPSSTKLLLGRV